MIQSQRDALHKAGKELADGLSDKDISSLGKFAFATATSFSLALAFHDMPITATQAFAGMVGTGAVAYNIPNLYRYVKDKIMYRNEEVVKDALVKPADRKDDKVNVLEETKLNEISKDMKMSFEPFKFERKEQKKSLAMNQEHQKAINRNDEIERQG